MIQSLSIFVQTSLGIHNYNTLFVQNTDKELVPE